jgi:isocitrate/isopropylmalate dehydrogenase
MLLEWLGGRHSREPFLQAASSIEQAVDQLLAKRETRTRDLGGSLGTAAFAAAVAERLLGEPGAR